MLQKTPVLRWLWSVIQELAGWLGGASKTIADQIRSGYQRLRASLPAASKSARKWTLFNRPKPDEQVIQYYLDILETGSDFGLGREKHQTPYQYGEQLTHSIPDGKQDVNDITETFLEARYSRHPISIERAQAVRQEWERIIDRIKKIPKKKA